MKSKEEIVIGKKYWFTWGLTTGLGIFILLMQLDSTITAQYAHQW